MSLAEGKAWVIGVDTGGTFTDFIAIAPDGSVLTHKRLSTPHDPGQAVRDGLDELVRALSPDGLASSEMRLVHGSTVATNAVLERKGARTVLLVTQGFRDLLLIGRQHRRKLYDLMPAAHPPLIPRELSFEVPERLGPGGEVVTPLDEGAVKALLSTLSELEVESVAVVFLHSYANPDHERKVADLLVERGFFVSASHDVLPEHREYERASTTALNAYVSPIMQRYLDRLSRATRARGFADLRVMQSSGGVTDAAHAGKYGVHTILSGPAGGVVGAFKVAAACGYDHIITLDMGGTSTDVSLVPGALKVTTESEIEGFPVRVPVLDIHTVGAGGGSIAWIDAGGALRVGPKSAGADPGPACYGRGGRDFTVTDANVLLGRLPHDSFLGGRMRLDVHAARDACRRLADALGSSLEDAAYNVLQVVASNMERAIKVISVERGYDPRDFCLVSFGGAGALHACELARNLSIPKVLVPPYPGVLSAMGMAVADVVKSYVQGLLGPLDEAHLLEAQKAARRLIERARADLEKEGVAAGDSVLHVQLDLRFQRQSFELTIPAPALADKGASPCQLMAELSRAFHQEHERAYGYTNPDEGIELVAVRVRAEGRIERPVLSSTAFQTARSGPAQVIQTRFARGKVKTAVYQRELLAAGSLIPGPAIIVEPHATTVIPPGDTGSVMPNGALLIEISQER